LELLASAELTANRRDRIFEAKAELRDADHRLIAAATGKYLPIPAADVPTMLTELVGDTSRLGDGNSTSP
jgi:hypothetical protein